MLISSCDNFKCMVLFKKVLNLQELISYHVGKDIFMLWGCKFINEDSKSSVKLVTFPFSLYMPLAHQPSIKFILTNEVSTQTHTLLI